MTIKGVDANRKRRTQKRLLAASRNQVRDARVWLQLFIDPVFDHGPAEWSAFDQKIEDQLHLAGETLRRLQAETTPPVLEGGADWTADQAFEGAVCATLLGRQLEDLRILSEALVLYGTTGNQDDRELVRKVIGAGDHLLNYYSDLLDEIEILDGTAKYDRLHSVRDDLWRETEARGEFDDLADQLSLAKARGFRELRNGEQGRGQQGHGVEDAMI